MFVNKISDVSCLVLILTMQTSLFSEQKHDVSTTDVFESRFSDHFGNQCTF